MLSNAIECLVLFVVWLLAVVGVAMVFAIPLCVVVAMVCFTIRLFF